jgi:YVTN family beta-propeller protein
MSRRRAVVLACSIAVAAAPGALALVPAAVGASAAPSSSGDGSVAVVTAKKKPTAKTKTPATRKKAKTPAGKRCVHRRKKGSRRVIRVCRTIKKPAAPSPTREVLFVGNNWDGTADIIDGKTFKNLGRFNVVPDKDQRVAEITMDPVRLGFFVGVRELIGEGNDQYVDDMFSSPDGRFAYVSRPSFSDVVAFDLETKKIVWRVPVEGYRSDHMAISPDGKRLLVSASTARKVHVIDTAAGKIVGEFASGDQPHESNYSADGKHIYHASIGTVYTPGDDAAFDGFKGDRYFQVVNAETLEIEKRLDIGQILRTFGFPGMSSAVRPMAHTKDGRFFYFQLSFLHGFVEFDLQENRPVRIANLPISAETAALPREAYLLDSAHHGLALSPDEKKLCVAGTMSDYAAIVDRTSFAYTLASKGKKPYWATNSGDGKHCVVSYSGDDRVAIIDYATEKEVASVPVGYHPQRVRVGQIRKEYVGG